MSVPPGASYRVSNALIKAKRRLLKLEDPARLVFELPWEGENELFKWYGRRSSRLIHTIQLRKEREAPFFHEFIVFSLRNDGGFFRIDRRQQPHENVPLDAIYTHGVEAYDTIEQVTSFDDILYGTSDCLVEIEFKPNANVHLALLLKICKAICQHDQSKVYTLQRYNCYFFAQTILLTTVCAASKWDGTAQLGGEPADGTWRWKSPNSPDVSFLASVGSSPEVGTTTQGLSSAPTWSSTTKFEYDWSHLSRLALNVVQTSPFLTHADECTHCRESQSLHRQRSLSSEIDRLKELLAKYWNDEFQGFIDQIEATGYQEIIQSGVWTLRVEDKSEKKCSDRMADVSNTMEGKWRDYHQQKLASLTTTLRDLLEPTEVCDAWEPHPDIWKSIWASNIGAPFQRVVKEWEDEMTAYFASSFSKLKESLNSQAVKACSQAHQSAINARLESFKDSMIIRHVEFKAVALATKDEIEQDGEKVGEILTGGAPQTTLGTRIKNILPSFGRSKYGSAKESDIEAMQELLTNLIYAHSVRVEQYKLWLKCAAVDVDSEIRGTMDAVWGALV